MVRAHADAHPDARVWHWSAIPEYALRTSGFIHDHNALRLRRCERMLRKRKRDAGEDDDGDQGTNETREYGLDGLAADAMGVYHGLQAKCWEAKRRLTATDLGSFISVVHHRLRATDVRSTGVLYTSAQLQVDLRDDLAHSGAIRVVHMVPDDTPEVAPVLSATNEVSGLELYRPQVEALQALEAHVWTESAALVSLPCGTGKTVVLGHHIRSVTPKKYSLVIVASPLRIHAKQTMRRLLPFFTVDVAAFLVDSDSLRVAEHEEEMRGLAVCTTDAEALRVALATHSLVFVSTTFKSLVNVIGSLDQLRSPRTLLALDEAHNITEDVAEVACNGASHTLLLTATPGVLMRERMADAFTEVYTYPLGDAIRDGFVCDYRLVIPTLRFDGDSSAVDMTLPACLQGSEDEQLTLKALFLANGMLEQGCVRCIVYCANIVECDAFCIAFRRVCAEYHGIEDVLAESVVANTTCAERSERLRAFEAYYRAEGRFFSLLTSVRILSEGVDLVTCDSVFLSSPSSDVDGVRSIQRMCRANRLDRNNPSKMAYCFVWADDMDATATMLHSLRFAGGGVELGLDRVCVQRSSYDMTTGMAVADGGSASRESATRLFARVQSIGCVGFRDMWFKRLQRLEVHIATHGRRPSHTAKNTEEKQLASWMGMQKQNAAKGINIMKDETVRAEWVAFVARHAQLFEENSITWRRTLQQLESYIVTHGRRPSQDAHADAEKKLGVWISTQLSNFTNGTRIMRDEAVRGEWAAFVERHIALFEHGNVAWRRMLHEIEAHIATHGRRPSANDPVEKKLVNWINNQQANFAKNENMMKDEAVRAEWDAFVSRHAVIFENGSVTWHRKLQGLEAYIATHGRRPSQTAKNADEKKLASWISTQQTNFTKGACIMKDEAVRGEWAAFVARYAALFEDGDVMWRRTLQQVEAHIATHGRRPSKQSKDATEKKLAQWMGTQQTNFAKGACIMKDEAVRGEWAAFVARHAALFEDGDVTWRRTLQQVEAHIATHGRRPSHSAKDAAEKKLAQWIGTQQQNFAKSAQIMKDEAVRGEWAAFVARHAALFEDGDVTWRRTLQQVEAHIATHGRRPSKKSKDATEKKLAQWMGTQQTNFAKGAGLMKYDGMRTEWSAFLTRHAALFEEHSLTWRRTLQELDAHIAAHGRRPSNGSTDIAEKKLAEWIQTQQKSFTKGANIMKYEAVRGEWEAFVARHAALFEERSVVWRRTLQQLEAHIATCGHRPSQHSKDNVEKKLANWITVQQRNVTKDNMHIMKDQAIRGEWAAFVARHAALFEENSVTWRCTLQQLEAHIATHDRRPSRTAKNATEKKLSSWISNQQNSYAKSANIMKDEAVRAEWAAFVARHAALF